MQSKKQIVLIRRFPLSRITGTRRGNDGLEIAIEINNSKELLKPCVKTVSIIEVMNYFIIKPVA